MAPYLTLTTEASNDLHRILSRTIERAEMASFDRNFRRIEAAMNDIALALIEVRQSLAASG